MENILREKDSLIFLYFSHKNGNKQRGKLDNWFPIFPPASTLLHHKTPTIPAASFLSRYMALKEQYAIVLVILARFFWVLLQFLLQK